MIILFTEFGHSGPYLAQMQAVLIEQEPAIPVLEMMSDAPKFNPYASSILLAAYSRSFPVGTIFVCVIDPGVGSERLPVVVEADGKFYVGPDNGLFTQVVEHCANATSWIISYKTNSLCDTFHGRDVFAPVAAMIACGEVVPGKLIPTQQLYSSGMEESDSKNQIVYIDHYGNCIIAFLAGTLSLEQSICVNSHSLAYARTFADEEHGSAFWYENSSNLIEIAVNCGDASKNWV